MTTKRKANGLSPQEIRKGLNPDVVKNLAAQGCSVSEIARTVNLSMKTILTYFSKEIEDGKALEMVSLRKVRWDEAINKRNTTILALYLKHKLKMHDKVELIDPNLASKVESLTPQQLEELILKAKEAVDELEQKLIEKTQSVVVTND